ncbi:hypothetical protein H2200_012630 [Cladophialophora chaetospira]|uniref:ZZ-type domain-containing protein n=1 Tax=Cladophialophora chaetospira TaxID=386627 RepID=A0AA38WXB9_9EURO|nr:hypothetical protein H2200_012630 [Cladophialophora chaetospira]
MPKATQMSSTVKGAESQSDSKSTHDLAYVGSDSEHVSQDNHEQQHDNFGSDQATATTLISPPSRSAVCDRCSKRIDGIRYKCQKCPDFDYCTECARLASSIHPGHDFLPLRGTEPIPEEDATDGHTDEEKLDPTAFRLVGHDTNMSTALCLSCQPVTMPLPAVGIIMKDEAVRSQAKNGLSLRWPARISKLVEATVGGCAFCSLVLYRFFGPGNGIFYGYEPDTPWAFQIDNGLRRRVIANAMQLLTIMKSDEFVFVVEPIHKTGMAESGFHRLRIELKEAKQSKEVLDRALASRGQQYVELDVCAAQGNPAAETITSRPPNPSPGSRQGFEQVKSWLAQCERDHGEACAPRDSRLPTRVIDVSDSNRLQLLQTSPNSVGKYVALSYCWGESQQFQTTTLSQSAMTDDFVLSDLPQTLQDGVTVTRALGIQYLWVDCLCIVQDDADDRAHEIAHMTDIYKHATLTISASKASAASKGFLHDEASPETGLWKNLIPLAFPIPNPAAKTIKDAFEMPREVLGTIWLCDEDPEFAASFRSPVDRRGWCLQERLLSSRFLSYGRWPTWRCRLGAYSDGGFYPQDPRKERHERQLTKCPLEQGWRRRRSQGVSDLQGTTDLHSATQLLQSWYKLVNEYTQRELGVKSDRLPAIGGIAAEISRATGFAYLAGLWQPNLLHDLMWSAKAKEWLTRPEGCQAATWSWASVDCPVSYDDITEDSLALAHVLDCHVDAGLSGAFGEVTGGRLELEGPFLAHVDKEDVIALLRDQGMAEPPPRSNDVQEWYRQIMAHIENQPKDKGSASEKWEEKVPDEVSAIITFSRDWRVVHEQRAEGAFYSGILLRAVDGGAYERIGAFTNEERGWLDQAVQPWERRKVVLV